MLELASRSRIGSAARHGRFRTSLPSWPFHRSAFAEAELTDRLSLTNALADANIDRKAAERIATEIFDAIHENVATKADIAAIKADLRELELRLDARIDRVVVRLGTLIVALTGILFAALHYWPPHG
jgi:hypothetical protein